MDEDFLAYYNSELVFLRELGAEFAQKYPKVAGRLQIEADKCADPHVERLLEGFALLTARVRQKIDDEYPEIAESLLGLLYPHYLRPVPSMAVVQMMPPPDGAANLVKGHTIDRGVTLSSRPVAGSPCQFRTAYPVTIWPVEITSARLQHDRVTVAGKPPEAVGLVQIRLNCLGGLKLDQLKMGRLRFYLDGEPPVVHALYDAILNHGCGVMVRAVGPNAEATNRVVSLPQSALRPVGFEDDEGMFPYPPRSFPGYRLIQEYFAFPEKFLFMDLTGLEVLAGLGPCDAFEILLFLDRSPRSEISVDAENFRLGCTPIVNLFSQVCEPITISQTRADYRVVPDVHRPMATEVYEIESVTSVGAYLDEPVAYEPFYAVQHRTSTTNRPYWFASRSASSRPGDPGTEVSLAFVDPGYRPTRPATDVVTVRALCTNRDLPAKLPFGGEQADFQLAAPGPVGRVRCVRKPSSPVRPRTGRGLQWPLISALSLNHLSLTDDDHGIDSLRQILRLHDFADSAVSRQQIEGVASIATKRVAGRVSREYGSAVCQGLEIAVEFDESRFVGSGVFLLASVLERFLSMYASINSFTQLVARVRGREGVVKRWPPRAGDRTLL